MFYSPLRYPGGKNKLAKLIAQICLDNNINGHYVEPYAGGAAVALYLLIERKMKRITINDYDKSIYAFWYSVLNHTKKLCKLIEETPVTIKEWEKQKGIQKRKDKASLLTLGFSTLFLNRTNISGIINAGPIGGIKQRGRYKLNCRFNKEEIIRRIKLISSFKDQISLFNLDAIELIKIIKEESNNTNTIFYFDPPYLIKGPTLYMNFYKKDDHKKVAQEIKKIRRIHWIISYDDVEEIRKIYKWTKNRLNLNITHTANKPKVGKEILFFSNGLNIKILPKVLRV